MNKEAQRIAIAEASGKAPKLDWCVMSPDESLACFWGTQSECEEWLTDDLRKFPESRYKDWHVGAWKRYPDYLNDLNAMHEAEKVLTLEQQPRYFENLHALNDWEWTATASQGAEAFLKTLGLWKEEDFS